MARLGRIRVGCSDGYTAPAGLLVKKSVLQIVLRRDRTPFRFSVKWKNRVRPLASYVCIYDMIYKHINKKHVFNVKIDFRFSCMGEGKGIRGGLAATSR
jgi:hypothetical protein